MGVAIKITVLVTCRTTPVSLKFKKDGLFWKILLSLGFCSFGFEAILYPSWYLTSTGNKTYHDAVITPFSVQRLQDI